MRSAETSTSTAQLPLVHQHLTASHWGASSNTHPPPPQPPPPPPSSNPAFQAIPQAHLSQQSTAGSAASLFANQPQMAALAAAAAAAGHYSLWPSYRAAAAAAAVAAIGNPNITVFSIHQVALW